MPNQQPSNQNTNEEIRYVIIQPSTVQMHRQQMERFINLIANKYGVRNNRLGSMAFGIFMSNFKNLSDADIEEFHQMAKDIFRD